MSAFFITVYMVNIYARQNRHSRVNFQEGIYHQQQQNNKKTLHKFFIRVFILSFIYFISYFASFQIVSAYPQVQENNAQLDLENAASQVFVLRGNGFVLKPSAQTEIGDRSTSHEVIEYEVEPGDTIFGIAAKFGIRSQTLTDNNKGFTQWTVLKPGKKLSILPVDGLLYMPSAKDSLDSIAKKYKIKKEDLVRQNQLEEGQTIAGVNLIIPGVKKPNTYVRSNAPQNAPSVYTGAQSSGFIWPANGAITQYYHRWHFGLDVANRAKGPIYSVANGVVIKAQGGWNGGYGNMVIIDHGNGMKTLYAHNEKLYVKVGDTVTQGETIAWMGNTGRVRGVTGIHLHFEVIKDGVKKNPLAYIGRQ